MSFDPRLPDEHVNVSEGSVLREAVILVVGFVGLTIAAVVVLALAVDQLVAWVPQDVEQSIFGGLSARFADSDDAIVDPDVQALVDRLETHWAESPYDFHVAVMDSEMPNAFAFPGGGIVVTTGLLETVSNENELAFVLGHELGHFRNRDHLRGLGRGLTVTLMTTALGLGENAAGWLAATAGSLSSRHFDRRQEEDADEFGLELLAREYGHVGGATEVFDRVLAGAGDDSPLGSYLSSHPTNPDRIDALRDVARHRGWAFDSARRPYAWTPPPEPPAADDSAASDAEAPLIAERGAS